LAITTLDNRRRWSTRLRCVLIYFFLDIYATKNYDLPKEGEQDAILLSDILRIRENSRWFILAAIGIVLVVLSFINSENWTIYLILLIVSALILFLKSKSFSNHSGISLRCA